MRGDYDSPRLRICREGIESGEVRGAVPGGRVVSAELAECGATVGNPESVVPLKKDQRPCIQGAERLMLSSMMYLALQRVLCRSPAFPFGRSAPEFLESRIPPAWKTVGSKRKGARSPVLPGPISMPNERFSQHRRSVTPDTDDAVLQLDAQVLSQHDPVAAWTHFAESFHSVPQSFQTLKICNQRF
jgi:hypothetical protein